MPSIRQIAKLAGVSIATVSRALSGAPYVKPETRERILELASLYNYSSNSLYYGAMSGNSRLIGVLIPTVVHSYYATILRGVLAQSFANSYQTLILESHGVLAHTCKALETMAELRVEGVIVGTGHCEPISHESLLQLWSHDIPVVLLDSTPAAAPVDRVTNDEPLLAEVAIDHLYALGHREIAYFGPCGWDFSVRERALLSTMRHRGLSVDHFFDFGEEDPLLSMLEEIMHRPRRPTAFIGFYDLTAVMIAKSLGKLGIRVPDDVSVLGFGNLEVGKYFSPELTTIDQLPEEIGVQTVDLLLQRIAEKTPAHEDVREVMIPPKLIVRESTGPLADGRP